MPTYTTPSASQVATYADSNFNDKRWLGSLGHVMNLTYSFNVPGGCDKMQCTLEVEPTYRVAAMDVGRVIQIYRGATVVWDGILDEPQPGTDGWTLTAVGTGSQAANVRAFYTSTWPTSEPDQS